MAQNINIQKDAALRKALQREGERLRMPEGLTENVMAQILTAEAPKHDRAGHRLLRWIAVAAAVVLAAFVVIVPQVRESKEMARYEGSYVEENGKRVDEYRLIKSDIHDAMNMADQAEMLAQQ